MRMIEIVYTDYDGWKNKIVSKEFPIQNLLDKLNASVTCEKQCTLLINWLPVIQRIVITQRYEDSYINIDFENGARVQVDNDAFANYLYDLADYDLADEEEIK